MKTKSITTYVSCFCATVAVALLAGCGTPGIEQVKSYPQPPDHAKTAKVHHPVAKAHKSAESALAVSGFNVTKQSGDVFIEGERPRKMGLFVGSGGEVCRIWLKANAPDETEVKVDSIKTFVGMMGQKEWDSTVLAEIIRDLNQ